MSFWEGGVTPEGLVTESLSDLQAQFLYWQTRARTWLAMINPEPTGRDAGLWLPYAERGEADKSRASRSEHVSNRVAAIYDNIVGRVSQSPPRIKTAVLAAEADQKDKQNMLERWCRGILNEQDYLTQVYGNGTSFARRMAGWAASLGKIVESIHVTESSPGSGEAMVTWELYDPLQCYHDIGATWPRRFIRHYRSATGDVQRMLMDLEIVYPVDTAIKNHDVAEFWVEDAVKGGFEVSWAVMVDKKLVADPKMTKLKRMNKFVITANASPTFATYMQPGPTAGKRDVTVNAIRNHAKPPFANLEHTHFQMQDYVSLIMDGMTWAASPVKLWESPDKSFLPPGTVGPGADLVVGPETKLKFLEVSVKGMEVQAVLDKVLGGEYDRAYNPILFGLSNPGDSGYKDYLKGNSAENQLRETSRCVGIAHELGLMEITQQFRDLGLKMTLEGRTKRGMEAGHFRIEEFSAKDFPEQFVIDVQMSPDVPKDDATTFAVATAAAAHLSSETILSEILSVDDPVAERQRREDEALQDPTKNPVMMQIKLLRSLVDEWLRFAAAAKRAKNPDRKQALSAMAEASRNQYRLLESKLLGTGLLPNAPVEPAGATFRPEVVPPQQTGKNPQLAAEAAGTPGSSTGVMGRPAMPGTNGGGAL